MRFKLAVLFVAALVSQPSQLALAKSPDKLTLDSAGTTAIVAVQTDWWPPAMSMKSAFKLLVSGFDPVDEKLSKGGVLFESQQKKFLGDYLLLPIKPGRYVVQSYSQQDLWALCFNANSLQFEVRPGEVVFLGRLDAKRHRLQLTEQTLRSGKGTISGYGFADFFDLPFGPALTPANAEQVVALKTALSTGAPMVTAPVRAAEHSPARFGTGSTLFAERRCGGYFPVSAKRGDKKAADAAGKPAASTP